MLTYQIVGFSKHKIEAQCFLFEDCFLIAQKVKNKYIVKVHEESLQNPKAKAENLVIPKKYRKNKQQSHTTQIVAPSESIVDQQQLNGLESQSLSLREKSSTISELLPTASTSDQTTEQISNMSETETIDTLTTLQEPSAAPTQQDPITPKTKPKRTHQFKDTFKFFPIISNDQILISDNPKNKRQFIMKVLEPPQIYKFNVKINEDEKKAWMRHLKEHTMYDMANFMAKNPVKNLVKTTSRATTSTTTSTFGTSGNKNSSLNTSSNSTNKSLGNSEENIGKRAANFTHHSKSNSVDVSNIAKANSGSIVQFEEPQISENNRKKKNNPVERSQSLKLSSKTSNANKNNNNNRDLNIADLEFSRSYPSGQHNNTIHFHKDSSITDPISYGSSSSVDNSVLKIFNQRDDISELEEEEEEKEEENEEILTEEQQRIILEQETENHLNSTLNSSHNHNENENNNLSLHQHQVSTKSYDSDRTLVAGTITSSGSNEKERFEQLKNNDNNHDSDIEEEYHSTTQGEEVDNSQETMITINELLDSHIDSSTPFNEQIELIEKLVIMLGKDNNNNNSELIKQKILKITSNLKGKIRE